MSSPDALAQPGFRPSAAGVSGVLSAGTSGLVRRLGAGLFCLVVLLVFVPLAPLMPTAGLDPSWKFAMSHAVAQGLVIGRDLLFTFGPYSAVYTELYHPATDHLMLVGSAFLASGFCLATLLWLRERNWLLLPVAAVLVLFPNRNFLLFAHCFVTMLAVYSLSHAQEDRLPSGPWRAAQLAWLFACIGLLPLSKLSLLPLVVLSTGISVTVLLLGRRPRLALLAVAVQGVAMAGFWVWAGQPLGALPDYLTRTAGVISGYAPAMAVWGGWKMPAFFILTSVFLAGAIARWGRGAATDRVAFAAVIAVYLFVSFKAGFVRHDSWGREIAALAGLLLSSLAVLEITGRRRLWLMVAVVLGVALATMTQGLDNPWRLAAGFKKTFVLPFHGLAQRVSAEGYEAAFTRSVAAIAQETPLPRLSGKVDIYSHDQSPLLASGNVWAPRPVFQSYAAYTKELAEANAAHLTGSKAPDHLFFKVQPIDGRFPALEDGASWPLLLNYYRAERYEGSHLHLRRRPEPVAAVQRQPLLQRTVQFAERVALPDVPQPIFARVEVENTLLGRIFAAAYRPTALHLYAEMANGESRRYALPSGMADSSFLLSPVIGNTDDFVRLAAGDDWALGGSRISSLRVEPTVPWLPLWKPQYRLTLETVSLTRDADSGAIFADRYAREVTPPGGQGAIDAMSCAGYIDSFRVQPEDGRAKLVSARGWVAVDTGRGIIPDEVFLHFAGEGLPSRYFTVQRIVRKDVGRHFGQPKLNDTGYAAFIDAESLSGNYQLSVAVRYQGRLGLCNNISKAVRLGP